MQKLPSTQLIPAGFRGFSSAALNGWNGRASVQFISSSPPPPQDEWRDLGRSPVGFAAGLEHVGRNLEPAEAMETSLLCQAVATTHGQQVSRCREELPRSHLAVLQCLKASPTPLWLFRRAILAILNWCQTPRLRSEWRCYDEMQGGDYEAWALFKQDENEIQGLLYCKGKGIIRGNGRRQSECWCMLAASYFSQQYPTKEEWSSFHGSQAASQIEGITASLGETFSPCYRHSKLTESLVTCILVELGEKKSTISPEL